jgi:hypothetical protein
MTRRRWTLTTVCLGVLMLLLDITIRLAQLPHLAARSHGIVEQATSGDPAHALRVLPPALRGQAAEAIRAAFVSGFDRILWVAAAVALAGAVAALCLVRARDFAAAGTRDLRAAQPSATWARR